MRVSFWDADAERLDLFDRFARLCFRSAENEHALVSTEDPAEALDGAEMAICQVGRNCARKYVRRIGVEVVEVALEKLGEMIPDDADVLSLQRLEDEVPFERFYAGEWAVELTEEERRAWPHQILRFLNGEEYVHEFLRDYANRPLTSWLEDRSGAALIDRSIVNPL